MNIGIEIIRLSSLCQGLKGTGISDYSLAAVDPEKVEVVVHRTVPGQGDRGVSLVVYDIMGREVIRWDRQEPPGYRQLVWNGRDRSGRLVPSGIYLYRLVAASTESNRRFTTSRKMLLLK